MKHQTNKLCPLTSNGDGTYSPSLIPLNYVHKCAGDTEVTFRPDLCGLVHGCGGMPLVEYDEAIIAVEHPSRNLAAGWGKMVK